MKPRPDLAVENTDDELIVLDKKAGKVHQLNSSATFVWKCLDDGLVIDEIVLKLSETFDVEPEAAMSDVDAVLSQLKSLGLVVE